MPHESYFSFYVDASAWVQLRKLLKAALEDVPASGWRPGVRQSTAENPLVERAFYETEHRKAYQPFSTEVWSACLDRFSDGVWPQMPPPVAYYARVSVRQAWWFVCGVCPEDDGECVTVFAFPKGSVEEVAAWFTTDWWRQVGHQYFMQTVCSDAEIFAHQFNR